MRFDESPQQGLGERCAPSLLRKFACVWQSSQVGRRCRSVVAVAYESTFGDRTALARGLGFCRVSLISGRVHQLFACQSPAAGVVSDVAPPPQSPTGVVLVVFTASGPNVQSMLGRATMRRLGHRLLGRQFVVTSPPGSCAALRVRGLGCF